MTKLKIYFRINVVSRSDHNEPETSGPFADPNEEIDMMIQDRLDMEGKEVQP